MCWSAGIDWRLMKSWKEDEIILVIQCHFKKENLNWPLQAKEDSLRLVFRRLRAVFQLLDPSWRVVTLWH